jgi:hypothetical protein
VGLTGHDRGSEQSDKSPGRIGGPDMGGLTVGALAQGLPTSVQQTITVIHRMDIASEADEQVKARHEVGHNVGRASVLTRSRRFLAEPEHAGREVPADAVELRRESAQECGHSACIQPPGGVTLGLTKTINVNVAAFNLDNKQPGSQRRPPRDVFAGQQDQPSRHLHRT